MTQILFYATKEDLLPIFDLVEAKKPLKYVRAERYTRPKLEILTNGISIPNLGIANRDSSIACDTYLSFHQFSSVKVRQIPQNDGTTAYVVDQLTNPDSVSITAGGVRGPSVLLSGRVATASESPHAQELMKLFASAFRKRFRKVKAFWVGQHALTQLEQGTRLTQAVTSPSEFDLKL